MRILKAALLYFALVFGAGFLLGPIRILWVVPRLGTRTAELIEAPIMLLVVVTAARWTVSRFSVPASRPRRLALGCIALGLLLVAEFSLVPLLRHISINAYLASRDPVSGVVYYGELGIFAIVPLFMGHTMSVNSIH